MNVTNQLQVWFSRRRAALALGVSEFRIKQLAASGSIKARRIPGIPDRYSASDIEALAQQAVQLTTGAVSHANSAASTLQAIG
jgi:hypothetical protein